MSEPTAKLTNKESRWPSALAWQLVASLWVCYALNHADRQILYTLFPVLKARFHFSDALLGLTGATFLWVYGLSSPLAGILGDRLPKPAVIVGSLTSWSCITIISGAALNGWFLLICRGFLGISESLFVPAAFAMLAAAYEPQMRSRAIAVFSSSQIAGVAFGGTLSGFLAERLSWRASFWVTGTLGLLYAGVLRLFLRRTPAAEAVEAVKTPRAELTSFFSLLRVPVVRVISIFSAASTFGLFLVYAWLPTMLFDRFHLDLTRAGFEASIYPQISSVLGMLAGGFAGDKLAAKRPGARISTVTVSLLCAAPCLLLLCTAPTLAATRFAVMAFTFFTAIGSTNQVPTMYDVVPASERSSSVGLLNLIGAVASGFGPFFGGLARQLMGFDRLLRITAAGYILTAAAMLLMLRMGRRKGAHSLDCG